MASDRPPPAPGGSPAGEDKRREAFAGPRALKEPGSVQWCYQTLELLKIRWERKESMAVELRAILDEVKAYKIWEKIPPDQPYGSEDTLLRTELGVDAAEAEQALTAAQIAAFTAKPVGPRGRPRKDGQDKKPYPVRLNSYGNGTRYLAGVLAQKHPDILKRMQEGEFKSVKAAARAAGIVKPEFTVQSNPASVSRGVVKRFSPEEVRELIMLLVPYADLEH